MKTRRWRQRAYAFKVFCLEIKNFHSESIVERKKKKLCSDRAHSFQANPVSRHYWTIVLSLLSFSKMLVLQTYREHKCTRNTTPPPPLRFILCRVTYVVKVLRSQNIMRSYPILHFLACQSLYKQLEFLHPGTLNEGLLKAENAMSAVHPDPLESSSNNCKPCSLF